MLTYKIGKENIKRKIYEIGSPTIWKEDNLLRIEGANVTGIETVIFDRTQDIDVHFNQEVPILSVNSDGSFYINDFKERECKINGALIFKARYSPDKETEERAFLSFELGGNGHTWKENRRKNYDNYISIDGSGRLHRFVGGIDSNYPFEDDKRDDKKCTGDVVVYNKFFLYEATSIQRIAYMSTQISDVKPPVISYDRWVKYSVFQGGNVIRKDVIIQNPVFTITDLTPGLTYRVVIESENGKTYSLEKTLPSGEQISKNNYEFEGAIWGNISEKEISLEIDDATRREIEEIGDSGLNWRLEDRLYLQNCVVPVEKNGEDDVHHLFWTIEDMEIAEILEKNSANLHLYVSDNRFIKDYEEVPEMGLKCVLNKGAKLSIKDFSIRLTEQLTQDFDIRLYQEEIFKSDYAEQIKNEKKNPIVDYERQIFVPVYSNGEEKCNVEEIKFNLRFRDREYTTIMDEDGNFLYNDYGEWKTDDNKGWFPYSEGGNVLGHLGFDDSDILRNIFFAVSASLISCRRRIPKSKYSFSWSMPINFRPNRLAAIPVVQLPANGSRIISPGLVEAKIIRYNNFSGFCVGCLPQVFSQSPTADNLHTSVICLSPFKRFITS